MTEIPIVKGEMKKTRRMRIGATLIAVILIQLFTLSTLFATANVGLATLVEEPFSGPVAADSKAGWDFERPEEWRGFARVDDDLAELVIGVSENCYAELVDLIARFSGKLVGTISMGGKIKAVVADMPFHAVSSFVAKARGSHLSRYIEPNLKFQTCLEPNDPNWTQQWGPKKIEANYAWNTTTGDPETVLVAVVDTGIDYTHPDLKPVSEGGNYVPLGLDWVNNDTDPMDDFGHGTHCAGIIAAMLNNNEGIAGLAQVRIMAEKGLDENGYGYDDDLANATVHAVDQGAKIISMSWGGLYSELIKEAMRYAYDHGVLLVGAAGNDATSKPMYPAAHEEVVAVTATDEDDDPAWFTNYGSWVDVAAPGVNILSTVSYEHDPYFTEYPYSYASGTSMACPHVSGVAALIWSRFPNLTRDLVRLQLMLTADDLGEPEFDIYYGYGRVNARKAVERTPADHDLIVVRLGVALTSGDNYDRFDISSEVSNYGTSNESDITVQLLVNDNIVDSKSTGFLASGNLTKIYFSWAPMFEGTYKFTCYTVPVPGETITDNNSKWKYANAPFKPSFFIDPLIVTAVPGRTFTVDVNLFDAYDIDGYQAGVSFNTSILDVVSVKDGPFPGTIGYRINNVAGYVLMYDLLSGESGDGTIATVTFNVEAEGTTVLNLYNTKINRLIGSVVVPISHRATDGIFTTTIQEAVNMASTSPLIHPGNAVYVTAGTYYESVTVNKPLMLEGENSTNTLIDGNGVGAAIYVVADGVTIKGFTVQNGNSGVDVEGSSQTVIANNNVSYNHIGIVVRYSSSLCTIRDNIISHNNLTGISVEGDRCTIINNIISETKDWGYNTSNSGILLDSSSNDNIVARNTIQNNVLGIWVRASSGNTIKDNVVSSNSYGIYLDQILGVSPFFNILYYNNIAFNTRYGIAITYCTVENHICHNYISNNKCGIYLDHSSNQIIRRNEISNNLEFGIKSFYSDNNVVYQNNFINNSFQAKCIHSINSWNDGFASEGNYWSDYTGRDGDGDGIGDTPYVINKNNKDNYPLMDPRSPLIGDVDSDWDVDEDDLTIISNNYGTLYPTWDPYWGPRCDIAGCYYGRIVPIPDGQVDIDDFGTAIAHVGDTWPPP